jgi:uncharacterized protein YjeT (DUF2065 family)
MRRHLNKKNFKRALHLSLILAGLMFVVAGMGTSNAQDVVQGYEADVKLQNGTVVRLIGDDRDKTKIKPLSQEEEGELLGVVVSGSQAPVSISDPEKTQVFVANRGRYEVLVSTQNGPIAIGDGLVISSLDGVAMKADDLHRVLVGKALENFSEKSDAEGGHIKLEGGGTVAVGRIMADISVARNPNYSGDTIAGVPHALSRIAYAVTDKPVTALRIYAGLSVVLICLVIAGAILYSGVHTALTSVGRNPLAKKSIWRNLFSVTLTALIVVSVGLFAVYLILKI